MRNARFASHFVRSTMLALVCGASSISSVALAQDQGEGMEEFEEVDPYTNGERELEKKLGYEKFGFLPWRGTEDSKSVQENMGGIPMLWVETAHFRIGSSLNTYKIPNDREERARLKEEIDRLKEKLGKLKAPKKKLDPYLRLHIYAQRAEDAYAAFHTDFGIEPADYEKRGPILGCKNKILLLLCERKSEYGRYMRTYQNSELEFTYRSGWHGEGLIVLGNVEAIAEYWKDDKEAPIDTMFHCMVLSSLAGNLVDGSAPQMFNAPAWLTYPYGHYCTKRIDPRYPFYDGRTVIYDKTDDSWNWQPRVRNLVNNEFFASAEVMFSWKAYEDMHARDHMVAWSKLEYLLTQAEGDLQGFLWAACTPLAAKDSRNLENERVTRQTRALATHLKLTPAELDEAWSQWVEKTYDKK